MLNFYEIKRGTMLTSSNHWYDYEFVEASENHIKCIPIRRDNKHKTPVKIYKGAELLETFKLKI